MGWYAKVRNKIASGAIDITTADIRVLILKTGYTQLAAHEFVADIVASELYPDGTNGYIRSITIANRALADNDGQNRSEFTHDPTAHGSPVAGVDAAAAVLFIHTGSDATAELLVYDPDTAPRSTNGQPLTYNPPAAGHFIENP